MKENEGGEEIAAEPVAKTENLLADLGAYSSIKLQPGRYKSLPIRIIHPRPSARTDKC